VTRDADMPDSAPLGDHAALDPQDEERLVLGDLVNLVLDKGVVVSGHVMISVADIDLVALDLRLLVTSIQTALEHAAAAGERAAEP
jgi:hypothetical protein